jgi:hypothetical protein
LKKRTRKKPKTDLAARELHRPERTWQPVFGEIVILSGRKARCSNAPSSWSPERSSGLSRSPSLKVALFTDHKGYDTLANRDVGRIRHSALCRDVLRKDAHDDARAMSANRVL